MATHDRDRYHHRHYGHLSDRELSLLIWETIMADFTALNAALAKVQTDLTTLLAAQQPPVSDQPAVDAATAMVADLDAKIVAATPPPPPPTPVPGPGPAPPQAASRG